MSDFMMNDERFEIKNITSIRLGYSISTDTWVFRIEAPHETDSKRLCLIDCVLTSEEFKKFAAMFKIFSMARRDVKHAPDCECAECWQEMEGNSK